MKHPTRRARRWCTAGLATTTLLTASLVNAEFITTVESEQQDAVNDQFAAIFPVHMNNDVRLIQGKINRDNDIDVWGFEIPRSASGLGVYSSGARVAWVLDKNRNDRVDLEDTTLAVTESSGGHRLSMRAQRNGAQILAVASGPENSNYDMSISHQQPFREIKATFVEALALDDFDGRGQGKPDFRASANLLDVASRFSGKSTTVTRKKQISNRDNPKFNLRVSALYKESTRKIPIVFSLVDQDPGKDDVADISPKTGIRALELHFDASLKTVFGPDGERLGDTGQLITVQGTEPSRAAATFRIDSKEPVVVR